MTIEEKISFLSQVKIILLDNNSWLDGTKEPIRESFDTAIKSLEAWEKVKEEIKDLDLGFVDEEYRAGVAYGIMKITKIIDKHLAEVEHGSHSM